MKAEEHQWLDHGRWRECAQCSQRQYRTASQKRGAQAFTTSVVSHWVPELEPCRWQDSGDHDPAVEPV
jgi:hypothetical protein